MNADPDMEKVQAEHVEKAYHGILSSEDEEFLANFSEEKIKRVLRKVDVWVLSLYMNYSANTNAQWRLVPMLLVLYLIAFIDRANIGNAKIEGLEESLNMTGSQYNIALAIFFVPYTLAEIPSNIILNRFRKPSTFMGLIVTGWGIVMTCTGVVQGFSGLCVTRVLLGLLEAGFFPGAILIITKWYLPHESQTRIAMFFTASAFAGAFSGLLAYAISKMGGVGGYESWRWIFLLEGIASVVIGLLCFPLLIDSPALSHRWLDPEEIRYLELRQTARHSRRITEDTAKKFDFRVFAQVLTDWKIYMLILAFWSNVTPNYGLKFTMPQIMKNMGYTSANAQLLTIPPYTVGAIAAYVFAVMSDRYVWRMPFIVGPQVAVVVAYAILSAKAEDISSNIAACYFAVCLACLGLYPIGAGVQAWNLGNLAGPTKRAMGIGYMTCIGNTGGITGSFIFLASEAPKYQTGFGASLGFAAAGIVACLVLELGLWRINERNARFTEDEIRATYSEDQLERMGDGSPLFKYTL